MSNCRQLLITALTALSLVSFTSTASAQDEPTAGELQQAGVHFQKGAEYYTAGEYNKAIVEFLKAYNAVPNALFLYNISLSYGKLGNVDDALAAALKARDEEGLDDQTANRNLARIDAFRRSETATEVAEEIAERRDAEPEPVAAGSRMGGLGWTGVAMMVVGAGLDVGALAINLSLASKIEDYKEAAQGDRATYERLREEIPRQEKIGRALLYTGSGMAVLGLTFLIVDLAGGGQERNVTAVIAPTADGGATAQISLRF